MKPEKVLARRATKRVIIEGASKFNSSAKEGLEFLAEKGILDKDLNPAFRRTISEKVISRFETNCRGIHCQTFQF